VVTVPGRLERIAERPPTFLDAAHNPAGAAALASSLPAVAEGKPVVAVLAVLADKDATAMVAALAPALDRAVCTELPAGALEGHGRPGARSRPAAELVAACRAVGLEAEAEADFAGALERGRALASAAEGVLLVAGSHYAIAPARVLTAA
jgi:dihydrofolate synthase/folylpolyglutamate synthase